VEELLDSYFAWRKHAIDVHLELGTQRLLDLGRVGVEYTIAKKGVFSYPVSRITLNDWGGVPSWISVKYWAFMKSGKYEQDGKGCEDSTH
jgi:hypothetical protein